MDIVFDRYGCIEITILWSEGGWAVVQNDFEGMTEHWRPGMAIMRKAVPLHEYLNAVADKYKLPYTFMASVANNESK